MNKNVWMITGSATGLGKSLVSYLLSQDCLVVATARQIQAIKAYIPNWQHLDNLLILEVDVTNQMQIHLAVQTVIEKWGTIDVLVNNAGYAYFSSIEFANNDEIKQLFDVNLWGVKNMLDEILPIMRQNKKGDIMNVSSLGGLKAFAGFGYYHATKFALEGLSESLALEVKPLGIHVTLLEPGDFKTDFASRSAKENKSVHPAYTDTAGKNIQNLKALSGNQPGDPKKAAKLIYNLQQSSDTPLHFLMGSNAYLKATEKLNDLKTAFEQNYQQIISTDYEQ